MNDFDLTTRVAIERGADSLGIMRKALVRAAQDLARLEERYGETRGPADLAPILAEAIQLAAANVLPGLRLELAADALAALAAAAATSAAGE